MIKNSYNSYIFKFSRANSITYCYSRISVHHVLQDIIVQNLITTSTFLFFQAYITIPKFYIHINIRWSIL
jgi:hypothetical protein